MSCDVAAVRCLAVALLCSLCSVLAFNANAQQRVPEAARVSHYDVGTRLHAAGLIDAAIKTFEEGAKNGEENSIFALATYYYFGEGVPQDDVKAHALLRQASGMGHAHADAMLGMAYRQGKGVAVDPRQAMAFLTKAANACIATAQNQLAIMFHAGEGVTQDGETALQWLYLAAEGGDADARDGVQQVERELAALQVSNAKQRASDLKKKMVCAD